MLFLTYIQGPATTEWVHSISDWLEQVVQVSNEYDQRLWDYTEEAFQRKFRDTLSEERAIAELRSGIKMEGGDLDGFINRFEILVCHARYDPDHSYGSAKVYRWVAHGDVQKHLRQGQCPNYVPRMASSRNRTTA